MKTQLVKMGLVVTTLLVGCQQNPYGYSAYQTQSREILSSMTSSVSTAFQGGVPRGVSSVTPGQSTYIPGSTTPGIIGGTLPVSTTYPLAGGTLPQSSMIVGSGYQNYPLVGGALFNPTSAVDAAECLAQVQAIPAQAQYYSMMVAALSRCLNRMLTDGNPLMTYGYRNLDPNSQNMYAYLLNWRQYGCSDQFSQNQFGVLNQFAGNGFLPQAATYSPVGSSTCPGSVGGMCPATAYPGLYGYNSGYSGGASYPGGYYYGSPVASVPGFTLTH
ncbi:MAG: hypothetical protein HYZ71_15900 [Deltaproteobacteria bacterium]|nr:hypothetical protein [Deltaproteobacteria bacterium]